MSKSITWYARPSQSEKPTGIFSLFCTSDKNHGVYNAVQGSQLLCSTARAQAWSLQEPVWKISQTWSRSLLSSALEMAMSHLLSLVNTGLKSNMGMMLKGLQVIMAVCPLSPRRWSLSVQLNAIKNRPQKDHILLEVAAKQKLFTQ